MSDVLITDLDEANLALAYLGAHMRDLATFSLFVRSRPAERGYLVAAGLDQALSYLERFRVEESDLLQLRHALGRSDGLLEGLREMTFSGDALAVPEGRIVFAGEPILEVTVPPPQAHLVESYLLNQVSFATALTSKAARCMTAAPRRARGRAAGGAPCADRHLRRGDAGRHLSGRTLPGHGVQTRRVRRPVTKLSASKATLPGREQVFRGPELHDVIARRDVMCPADAEPLLAPHMSNGARIEPALAPDAAVAAACRRFRRDLDQLSARVRRVQRPSTVVPVVSAKLRRLTAQVRETRD